MRIRLLKPLNGRKIGAMLEVGDGVAEMWIKNRKAERVERAKGTEVPAMMVPPHSVELEIHTSNQGQRGRPRRQTV